MKGMRRKSSLLILFLFAGIRQLKAQQQEPFRLTDGTPIRIEVWSAGTVRVRVDPSGAFPQSLMERYGIIQTPGEPVKYTELRTAQRLSLTTDSLTFSIAASGEMSLRRTADGALLLDRFTAGITAPQATAKLRRSLETYFGPGAISSGTIIGDNAHHTDTVKTAADSTAVLLGFPLQKDERLYGLGNASRESIQHRGFAARIWVQYQHSESPMPFIQSDKGWGIFYNSTRLHFFDAGCFDPGKLLIYAPGEKTVDFFLFAGRGMPAVLDRYTTLTGKPYVLPRWAYGFAFGSNTMENQFNVLDNAYRFRQENMPCDIYWLEPQWMSKHYDYSTSQDWDRTKFVADWPWSKDYERLFIRRLDDMGFKLALWLCVDHDFSVEEEDRLSLAAGHPLSGQEHWFDHLGRFMDEGVKGFKLDPARTLEPHPDRKYYNGRSDAEMHLLNQVLLVKNLQGITRVHTGLRSFHHYCGGYAGSPHYAAATLGDNGGRAGVLTDVFNLAMSGSSNVSCDMLEGVDPILPGLHMAFFLPWVQQNSWAYTFHPFYRSAADKAAFRFYDQLRYRLLPYIYSNALEAGQTGMPMARPMPLAYPNDPRLSNNQQQWLFGENLLVAAFTDSVILPKGRWIDFWSGRTLPGGRPVKCQLPPQAGGPLFIRAGAIIPEQQPAQSISPLPPDTLMLQVYPEDRSSFTLLEDDGQSYAYEKGGLARTRFDCDRSKSGLTFTVAAVKGTYTGMPEQRTYLLAIHYPKRPRRITVNRKAITGWRYDATNHIVHLDINCAAGRGAGLQFTD
jgi:alpha-glucosidase